MSSFAPINALRGAIRHGWQDVFFAKAWSFFNYDRNHSHHRNRIGTETTSLYTNQELGLTKDQVVEIRLRSSDQSKGSYLVSELQRIIRLSMPARLIFIPIGYQQHCGSSAGCR